MDLVGTGRVSYPKSPETGPNIKLCRRALFGKGVLTVTRTIGLLRVRYRRIPGVGWLVPGVIGRAYRSVYLGTAGIVRVTGVPAADRHYR